MSPDSWTLFPSASVSSHSVSSPLSFAVILCSVLPCAPSWPHSLPPCRLTLHFTAIYSSLHTRKNRQFIWALKSSTSSVVLLRCIIILDINALSANGCQTSKMASIYRQGIQARLHHLLSRVSSVCRKQTALPTLHLEEAQKKGKSNMGIVNVPKRVEKIIIIII